MLDVNDLRAGYGSTEVLQGVTLSVRKGEVVSILGRNGVGKTTLMKALIGLNRPWAGQVALSGSAVAGLPPEKIARSGLAYVPQGRGIFHKLSVMDNLTMGTRARRDRSATVPAEIFEMFPILAERRNQLGGTLSGGQQQQLALGRALAAAPDFLLLDEPSEGIQPNIVQMIGDILRKLAAEKGLGVLLVEQNLDLGLSAADRVLFMEKGRIVHESAPQTLEEETLHRYLAI
ncbi:urea ABC transporter ATP-binding subunit UrtE [Shinella sp. M31]|uniref:urea ABC transporter ATP-binding subunit UrtE n=1 Tax=Shinella sp. M31 TaxID=3368615 RepID=UPI003BA372C6